MGARRLRQLENISLSVLDGQLYSIVGPVGSGKSTLLAAILGDTYKLEGNVTVRGSVAYIPQTPWIMNATIRDNILFGKPMDTTLYNATLEACALVPDLESMSGGDMTEIGERGINLSGGQKSRISIARAVYARADLYLVDDALSAVDAHVGRHIFDNVLGANGVLKSKARILVTHGIQYLSKTDKVLMLADGKIGECGNYNELMQKKSLLYNLIKDYGKQHHPEAETAKSGGTAEHKTVDVKNEIIKSKKNDTSQKTNIMTAEESAKGKVQWAVYKSYADACHLHVVIGFIFICIFAQSLSVSQNLLLAKWAETNDRTKVLSLAFEKKSVLPWLIAYGY